MRPPHRFFRPQTRARRVAILLGILWLLAFADLFFTIWARQFTPFEEMNPIARRILHLNSLAGLIAYKVVLTGIATVIFWSLRKHRIAELGTWLVVIAYLALTLRWSDYTRDALQPGMLWMGMPPLRGDLEALNGVLPDPLQGSATRQRIGMRFPTEERRLRPDQ